MPTTRRSREVPATPAEIWEIVGDPFHLPRWWPRVGRVEGFDGEQFTQVLTTQKGRAVRADFKLTENEAERVIAYEQMLEDTPFERVLKLSSTRIELEDAGDGSTRVTLELTQQLRGMASFSGRMMKGATKTTLDEALTGLQALVQP